MVRCVEDRLDIWLLDVESGRCRLFQKKKEEVGKMKKNVGPPRPGKKGYISRDFFREGTTRAGIDPSCTINKQNTKKKTLSPGSLFKGLEGSPNTRST
jgi:hypothetical protein